MNPVLEYGEELASLGQAGAPKQAGISRAWWAVVARFLIHGLVTATWVSRIPSVKAGLGLGDGVFGFCLFGAAIGSLIGIPVCGWFVTRYGSKSACTWTSIGYCLALVLPAFASTAFSLFGALLILGAMAGGNDVAMNSQAVTVERLLGSPTMSRFHAMFSIGGIAGAAAGGFIAAHSVSVTQHFIAMCVVFLTISILTAPMIMDVAPHRHADTRESVPLRLMPTALLALCAIGFCIFLSEGAMADWTAIYLHQVLHAGDGLAAAGYAVFSAAMAVFRLFGDAITVRLGFAWTIRAGARGGSVRADHSLVGAVAVLGATGICAGGRWILVDHSAGVCSRRSDQRGERRSRRCGSKRFRLLGISSWADYHWIDFAGYLVARRVDVRGGFKLAGCKFGEDGGGL